MEGLSDCQAIKAEEELTIAASKIDIYSKKESFACQSAPHLFLCFVHVLFLHTAKRPNGRLAQVLPSRQGGHGFLLRQP